MLGLLSSLAVFALLFLNSQAWINLVLASYCSAARLGYRGAGVNPRTLFFFFLVPPLRERSCEDTSRTASPLTDNVAVQSELSLLQAEASCASECFRLCTGGSCNMLDPPALRSHVSHIWVPAIGYFIYTSRALFVHITLQNTVWFIGVTLHEAQVLTSTAHVHSLLCKQ